jgi:hypothetical protein
MEDFIVSKHGKGKNAKYYKIINKPGGITEISRSTYYRLSKSLERLRGIIPVRLQKK